MLNVNLYSIALMLKEHPLNEEVENLVNLFKGVQNKAAFARNFKIPGGPSMISQHLSGHRPINLAAATAYAKAFGIPVSAISQRLADLADDARTTTEDHPSSPSEKDQLLAVLKDWRLQASPRSLRVIDQLTVLAQKNTLRDEDWKLIEQLADRLNRPAT